MHAIAIAIKGCDACEQKKKAKSGLFLEDAVDRSIYPYFLTNRVADVFADVCGSLIFYTDLIK